MLDECAELAELDIEFALFDGFEVGVLTGVVATDVVAPVMLEDDGGDGLYDAKALAVGHAVGEVDVEQLIDALDADDGELDAL